MNKKIHVCMSVRGAIRNIGDYNGWATNSETGEPLSRDEFFNELCNELAAGHEVIPLGDSCEGFDYSGAGCPGHPCETEPGEGGEA